MYHVWSKYIEWYWF